MRFPQQRPDLRPIFAGAGGMMYPFLVYFGLPHLALPVLVISAVAFGAVHALGSRVLGRALVPSWLLVAIPCVLLLLLALRPILAMQAYPPLVSLSLAGAFAWSLRHPPSAIERLARLTHPDLPSEGVAYTRLVTKIWIAFFLANAAIATVCALWFSVAIWALWTGFFSYLGIGALFTGEVLFRRWAMHQAIP